MSIDSLDRTTAFTGQVGVGVRLGVDVGLGVESQRTGAFARIGIGLIARATARGIHHIGEAGVELTAGLSLRGYVQHEEGFDLTPDWRVSQRTRLSLELLEGSASDSESAPEESGSEL